MSRCFVYVVGGSDPVPDRVLISGKQRALSEVPLPGMASNCM